MDRDLFFRPRFYFSKFQLFPSNGWTKYPYTKDRLDLLDNVTFSSEKVSANTFNGKLIYFK